MTKVIEQLRAIMIKRVAFALEHGAEPECYTDVVAVATRDVDAFITILDAEGFAEGVEDSTSALALVEDAKTLARGRTEGRKEILEECSCIAAEERSLHQAGREFVAGELWYYFPASILTTEEKL